MAGIVDFVKDLFRGEPEQQPEVVQGTPDVKIDQESYQQIKAFNRFNYFKNLYNKNPQLFSDQAVEELEKFASELGEQFDPYPTPKHALIRGLNPELNEQYTPEGGETEFNPLRTIGQVPLGFLEGLMWIANLGDKPTNTAEHLTRNIGNLLGFIGVPIGDALAATKLAGLTHLSAPSVAGYMASRGLTSGLEKIAPTLMERIATESASKVEKLLFSALQHGSSMAVLNAVPALKEGLVNTF